MGNPRYAAQYGWNFQAIASAFMVEGKTQMVLDFETKGKAVNFLSRFYSFRQAYVRDTGRQAFFGVTSRRPFEVEVGDTMGLGRKWTVWRVVFTNEGDESDPVLQQIQAQRGPDAPPVEIPIHPGMQDGEPRSAMESRKNPLEKKMPTPEEMAENARAAAANKREESKTSGIGWIDDIFANRLPAKPINGTPISTAPASPTGSSPPSEEGKPDEEKG